MEKIIEKETVQRVKDFLNNFNPQIKIIVLSNSASTAKDASKLLKCEVGAIIKSLLIKTDNYFLICLVAGDKRCSLKKIKKIINKKDVYMASADEVKKITGFSIGGVSPVGHVNQVDIFVDKSLSRFKNLFAAAGHPNSVFETNYNELLKITKGYEKEISE